MYFENLKSLSIPIGFTTRAEANINLSKLRRGEVVDDLVDIPKFQEVVNKLSNPDLDRLIEEGRASIGLVKPRVFESRSLSLDDDVIATGIILQEARSKRVMFHMPWQFTKPDVEGFYAPIKDQYLNVLTKPPSMYGTTIWEAVITHASSGPLTLMVIGGGGAIDWWRSRIGKTRPSQASPESIRGKYGIDEMLPNNLVHGSDSIESAMREITAIRSSMNQVLKVLLLN